MIDLSITVLLWFSAIGCGLIGGLYFAFSAFVMRALGRIEAASGIAAMNAINETILRSLFMPLFWGTTLASTALVVIALIDGPTGATAMFLGGIVYVVGMFVCTVVFNVPLNNALAAVGSNSGTAASVWQRYLDEWTRWNHVRTIACTVASAAFVLALIER